MAAFVHPNIAMTSSARLSLVHLIARVGLVILLPLAWSVAAVAQVMADGPTFAEVPEDVSIKFMFKSSGNYNMVGSPDIPVVVSVVLTNKGDEPLSVFVTRYINQEDDKPLDFPLGCAVRITDAKGTALLQHAEHPDGYWTSLTTAEKDDAVFRKDSRNHFDVPSKERRAFNIPLATLLAGGTGPTWPVADGKLLPGAYRFKVRWAGKESPEFSLTITPK